MEYGSRNIYEKELYKKIDDLIERGVLDGKNIYFYGITNAHNYAIKYLMKKGFSVEGIVDKAAEDRKALSIEHVSLFTPKILGDLDKEKSVFLLGGNHNDTMCRVLSQYDFCENQNVFRIFNPSDYVVENNEREISESEELALSLDALKYLDKVCLELGVDYFLAFGTLIGAVRHKGCIPWDNDIDVLIRARDLKAIHDFIEADESNEKYKLLLPGYDKSYPFLTGMLINTDTYENRVDFPLQITTGVGLDVSILVDLGDTEEEARRNRDADFDFIKDFRVAIESDGKDYSFDDVLNISTLEGDNHKYVGCMWGNTYKCIYEAEWFKSTSDIEFEGNIFKAPIGTHEYLTLLYNDYMKLPPVEDRNHMNHVWKNYWKQ